MLERDYQKGLIKRIKDRFPDSVVLKNDSGYMQGIPDLTVLCGKTWAALEVKPREDAPYQPNQEHYLAQLDAMNFSATIYPENEEEVLDALQRTFKPRRSARLPKS